MEVFYKKAVLKNFENLLENACASTGLQLYQNENLVQVFSNEFCGSFRSNFLQDTSGGLIQLLRLMVAVRSFE